MYDRTDFNQVVNERLRNIHLAIDQAKQEEKESIMFPFFIMNNTDKHFHGFKGQIIDQLKSEGYHVTNLLPGFREAPMGITRDMYIAWTDRARKEGEEKGYEFR